MNTSVFLALFPVSPERGERRAGLRRRNYGVEAVLRLILAPGVHLLVRRFPPLRKAGRVGLGDSLGAGGQPGLYLCEGRLAEVANARGRQQERVDHNITCIFRNTFV